MFTSQAHVLRKEIIKPMTFSNTHIHVELEEKGMNERKGGYATETITIATLSACWHGVRNYQLGVSLQFTHPVIPKVATAAAAGAEAPFAFISVSQPVHQSSLYISPSFPDPALSPPLLPIYI